MGVCVPLTVIIVGLKGYEFGQGGLDVTLDRGVRALVDGNTGGGVGNIDIAYPARYPFFLYQLLDLIGYVNEFIAGSALHIYVFDHLSLHK
jgi:hypothetical protein